MMTCKEAFQDVLSYNYQAPKVKPTGVESSSWQLPCLGMGIALLPRILAIL